MRRQYPAEKRTRLLALASGGVQIYDAAQQLGVRPATAYYCVRQAAKETTAPVATKTLEPAKPTFVQLIQGTAPTSSIEVRIGAAVIAVKPGFDAELLRAVVSALSGGPQ
jgi:transposase-like protein